MILEIEDSNQNIYVCNIVECDEHGKLVFENLKDSETSISIADITFDEYFIVECDEHGKLVFENLKDSETSISIADITFDEYFGTNDIMIRLHLEE